MIDELNQAIEAYKDKWQKLVDERKDKAFFAALKPTAVGWKVADRAEYDRLYAELHDQCDITLETWMNRRWIAKMHLRDQHLGEGIEIIKLMQRRPGSSDAVGLDHLDFYSPMLSEVERVLTDETDLKWTQESNDIIEGYNWISIWFAGTEAKLKHDTVLEICVAELNELNRHILDGNA
jgi:hypothetical protein